MQKPQGIYIIFNEVNGKYYIGSSSDVNRRLKEHKRQLVNNSHYNVKLQAAWNKYGCEAFSFEFIEAVQNIEDLVKREREIVLSSDCIANGYNFMEPGALFLPEMRAKMGLASKGHKMSDEHKERLRLIITGRKHSLETCRKIGARHKGRVMSDEQKRYLSELYKGRPISAAKRQKLIEANTGRPCSEATRRKVSEAQKGRKHTEETKRKLSENKKTRWANLSEDERRKHADQGRGKTPSEETRIKLSEALKASWQRKKGSAHETEKIVR